MLKKIFIEIDKVKGGYIAVAKNGRLPFKAVVCKTKAEVWKQEPIIRKIDVYALSKKLAVNTLTSFK